MNQNQKYSDLYLTFLEMDYRKRIRFFEEKILNDISIDYLEKIELNVEYAFALFEIGRYEKYLSIVDELIETVIYHNIGTIKNEDAFQSLVFKKANSLYNLELYDEAIGIYSQLRKIDISKSVYKLGLNLALRRKNADQIKRVSIVSILLIGSSILIKIFDIFFVDPFYLEYHPIVNMISDFLAIAGLSFLAYQYFKYFNKKYAP
jgi:tetratricopeptide (TPR) repeat protein